VFVDWNVESQGNLLSNSRTAPGWIALFCLNNDFDEFSGRSLWTGLAPSFLMRRAGDTSDSSEFGEGSRESKVSIRWLNGSDGHGE
jgi:hypothetical protein